MAAGGVAGTTGADGVTALDGSLAGESPAAACVTTVTVYAVPACAPRTQVVSLADQVLQVAGPGWAWRCSR